MYPLALGLSLGVYLIARVVFGTPAISLAFAAALPWRSSLALFLDAADARARKIDDSSRVTPVFVVTKRHRFIAAARN